MLQSFVMAVPFFFSQSCGMKPKTETFLYLLLWSADKWLNPTFRNLTDSFESWAYRNGLWRQIAALEEAQLIQRDPTSSVDRLYRLTGQGRLHALGGRVPQVQWSRKWDGRWRLVSFDIPTTQNAHRLKLWRYLRDKGFGCLQNSVWITPDLLEGERQILSGGKIDVGSLILLEARPCAGESDAEIVAGAWDFGRINRGYARHMKVMGEKPCGALGSEPAAKTLLRWAAAEREAWLAAVRGDPLLPERILPADYLGQQAWRRRAEVLQEAGRQLRTFRP
jgi:phenylacetic acid degradation operon negative regulatory protein